jgi:protein-tyrosine phosphatase
MNCSFDLDLHHSDAVLDKYISIAMESAQKDQPATCILDLGGKLYLGGFLSSGEKFVVENKITRIINCALGLEKMYVGWGKQVTKIEKTMSDVKFLRLGWMDTEDQKIYKLKPGDQIEESIRFIHEGLKRGENVVIHCAQGKSRSGTVAIAYLMIAQNMNYREALKYVQEKRPMVQPNPSFETQLQEYDQNWFTDLRKSLNQ